MVGITELSSDSITETKGESATAQVSLDVVSSVTPTSTWVSQPYPAGLSISAGELSGVSCPSASECFSVGFGTNAGATILATTDGGSTWNAQSYPSGLGLSAGYLNDLSCFSSGGCIAVGAGSSGAVILGTTDGGSTWTAQSYPSATGLSGGYLLGISCSTVTDCIAVGAGSSGAVILATTDGGTTWSTQTYPSGLGLSGADLFGVSCSSASDCTFAGPENDITNPDPADQAAVILATTNGGVTWSADTYPSGLGLHSNGELLSVDCVDTGQCWAVGQQGDGSAVILMNVQSNQQVQSTPAVSYGLGPANGPSPSQSRQSHLGPSSPVTGYRPLPVVIRERRGSR